MGFQERLKQARLDKGLTQEQLADLIGVAKSTLNGYEKGNREPDFFKIKMLIEVLGVDANYLLCVDESETTKKAPAQNAGDALKDQLLHNYDQLNALGREKLVDYSDDLTGNEKYTQVIPAAQKEA